tara:strand:+ start:3048 stop:3470 length:423 start_codon:yes stop_codon:yes gene_type:complete
MTQIKRLKTQAADAIEGIDSLMKSLRVSQQMYQDSSTIYPPNLDRMIDEVGRDFSCLTRRWRLLITRLDDIEKQGDYNADIMARAIGDFRDIRMLYIQGLAKVDEILFEFQAIDDVDRALFQESDFLEDFGPSDDEELYE